MNWLQFWNNIANQSDLKSQVGRIHDEEIVLAATHIIQLLNINENDEVLDVCCGNGLLTKFVSQYCKNISAIDFSETLIKEAKSKSSAPNISYLLNNAKSFQLGEDFDKIYLSFSFQYFETYDEGKEVLSRLLKHSRSGTKILISDIPDKSRWGAFYNTFLKKFFYYKQKLSGNEIMGKFWSEDEMKRICYELGVKGRKIIQPSHLPYAHYRFDWLIE